MIIGGAGQCISILMAIGPACHYNDDEANPSALIALAVIGAIFSGFGAAVLWISSATYAAVCAAPTNRGFFFGFSYALFLCAMSVANIITWSLLSSLNEKRTVATAIAICTILSFHSIIFMFCIDEPLICQSDEDQGHILQASELSKVNDYFTNKSGASYMQESYFIKNEEKTDGFPSPNTSELREEEDDSILPTEGNDKKMTGTSAQNLTPA